MTLTETAFLEAISTSFAAYNVTGGARSSKKLVPIHRLLSEMILARLGDAYTVRSLGIGDGKEARVEGKYYPKNLDIAVFKGEVPLGTLSFKFVTSNFKQNANNYFESLMGECANLRSNGIVFAHLLVLRGHTPYYSKNKGNLRGTQTKTEIISERNIQKYIKLMEDSDVPHRPDALGICLVDFDQNNKAQALDLDMFDFSDETKNALSEKFSLSVCIDTFVDSLNKY